MNQLRKNVFLLALLAVIAGALGLYVWLGVIRGEEQERAQAKAEARFLPHGGKTGDGEAGAPPEYVRIVLSTPSGNTTLEPHGDGWRIVMPVNAPVDSVVMDTVKSQLDTLELSQVIEEKPTPADLQRYGLSPPTFTVAVTTRAKDGKEQTLTLKGGGENTFDGSIYLMREGDPRVYAAPGGVRFNLLRSTLDLRDKQVMKVPAKDLRRVEVVSAGGTLVLERQDKKWKLLKPEVTDADPNAVSMFLGGLATERARSFRIDSSDERAKDGLDEPVVQATFTPEKGEPIRLELGRPASPRGPDAGPGSDAVFVLRSEGHETTLAEVGLHAITALTPDPATLRNRSVIAFEKNQVARIEFLEGNQRIVVERALTDGGSLEHWNVVAPVQGPAKKFKMTSILWTLGSLKAEELHDLHPKHWAKWGLEKPRREVKLYDAKGELLAALAVGNPVEGKTGVHYARGTRDQVVEMKTERLVDLPKSVDDVLDVKNPLRAVEDGTPGR